MQLNMVKPDIVEYDARFQDQVEKLVVPIQRIEFGVQITREEQPDLLDIAGTFQRGHGNFWVAVSGDHVIGSIGIVDIGNGSVALKKMFVRADKRGKQSGVAAALMERAKRWCRDNGISKIYLGTTKRMTAAHRFYEKNGFAEISHDSLPELFPLVHVDSKFYVCQLI
jgi:GNAT superfamily N-acetyltransferase